MGLNDPVPEADDLPDEASLAGMLRRWMGERGLSQEQLQRRSGVPKATLSRWLSGKSRNPYYRDRLLRIAEALDLPRLRTDRLLAAADLPLIDATGSADPDESALLARWIAPVRNNLPAPLTSFVGRADAILSVGELLLRDDTRLMTLTGTGGSGKTRLALRVAGSLLDVFPDGLFWVPLAAVTDPSLVIPRIAESVGLRDVAGSDLRDRLEGWLRERRVLLLLDNLEQISDCGPDLVSLLAESAGLKLLTTSRVPLHVSGEYEWQVRPLPLPEPALSRRALLANPAVALFVQRAEAANPRRAIDDDELPAIAELCARLDGLPLAIELAAARTRDREPAELLSGFPTRLDLAGDGPLDVVPRQRTLRETIAWSVDLLPAEAREFLPRLSVFAGGWTADAAEAVCADDAVPADMTAALLATLMDASLIERVEMSTAQPRYRMLETIREFGLERLSASGLVPALRERHAAYFLALAESAPPYVPQARQGDWYERIDADVDNLRSALDWSTARDDLELMARFCAALWPYWHENLRIDEGRRWLEAVLPRVDELPPRLRASIMTGACNLTMTETDYDRGTRYGEEALRLWQELGSPRGEALIYQPLGWKDYMTGRPDEADRFFDDMLRCWRLDGEPLGVICALGNLAVNAFTYGRHAEATQYLDEAEELSRRAHDEQGLIRATRDRGLAALLSGDVQSALPLLMSAVDQLKSSEATYLLPAATYYLGLAQALAGQLDAALISMNASLTLHEAIDDKFHLALTFLGFAAIAHRQGDAKRAAILCGAAHATQQANQLNLPPTATSLYEREVGLVLQQLDHDRFQRAFALGSGMTLPEAIAFARRSVNGR